MKIVVLLQLFRTDVFSHASVMLTDDLQKSFQDKNLHPLYLKDKKFIVKQ